MKISKLAKLKIWNHFVGKSLWDEWWEVRGERRNVVNTVRVWGSDALDSRQEYQDDRFHSEYKFQYHNHGPAVQH